MDRESWGRSCYSRVSGASSAGARPMLGRERARARIWGHKLGLAPGPAASDDFLRTPSTAALGVNATRSCVQESRATMVVRVLRCSAHAPKMNSPFRMPQQQKKGLVRFGLVWLRFLSVRFGSVPARFVLASPTFSPKAKYCVSGLFACLTACFWHARQVVRTRLQRRVSSTPRLNYHGTEPSRGKMSRRKKGSQAA